MANTNEKEKLHRDCEPHTAENCDINDHHNLEPGKDDCGHTVKGIGPGMEENKKEIKYEIDANGRKVIIAGPQ